VAFGGYLTLDDRCAKFDAHRLTSLLEIIKPPTAAPEGATVEAFAIS
jgi:hypothetical protein